MPVVEGERRKDARSGLSLRMVGVALLLLLALGVFVLGRGFVIRVGRWEYAGGTAVAAPGSPLDHSPPGLTLLHGSNTGPFGPLTVQVWRFRLGSFVYLFQRAPRRR